MLQDLYGDDKEEFQVDIGSHNDVMCKKAAAGFDFRSGLFNITSRTLCAPMVRMAESGGNR